MRVLFIGDIVGRPGRRVVKARLPEMAQAMALDAVVANAENAAGGFGLTGKVVQELFDAGIQLLTTGNHVWDKKEGVALLDSGQAILRPHNYPPGNPGKGVHRLRLGDGRALWVVNLQGRVLMPPVDCPFRAADSILEGLPHGERCVVVDFHAEATSEKRALGLYLDGRVSAVIGTHTHVQTADEEVLPKGTAFLTDVGMTGPYDSVIGMQYKESLQRMLLATPKLLTVADRGVALAAAYLDLDDGTGRCLEIRRVFLREAA